MTSLSRLLMVILIGLLLLGLPYAVRTALLEQGSGGYQPPQTGMVDLAATPAPTSTAAPAAGDEMVAAGATRAGPVVVDLAHFNRVGPGQFQPLAARLAANGIGMRFWMNPTPPANVDQTNLAGLADQSADLAAQLRDATAFIVVSPLFLWQPAEIQVVEKFVADGGRLLLISDPDLPEAPDFYIRDLNKLGDPFGIVFNDDYLYDLTRSDDNFTHVFQAEFLDRAAELSGKTIALYGVRSLSGPIVTQVRVGDTTRSSLRNDLSGFTTVAIGGLPANDTSGRVLAMGDFDVLTDPYVSRHDNRLLLEFVADFLVGGTRDQELADFPAYLGPRVALALGAGMPLDAATLGHISQLQWRLQASGRTFEMVGPSSYVLTGTVAFTRPTVVTATGALSAPVAGEGFTDLIYAATFGVADDETTLLAQAGIRLADVTPTPDGPTTPTPPPTATPAGTPQTPAATATATTTPVPTRVLETGFSPQLLADDSVILFRRPLADDRQLTAVLGSDIAALEGGLIRLYTGTFADCVIYPDLLVCPFTTTTGAPEAPPTEETPDGAAVEVTDVPTGTPEAVEPPPPGPGDSSAEILLIDDNRDAADEAGELAVYEPTLFEMGYAPVLWQTADSGEPVLDDLVPYDWVIWSRGSYEESEPAPETLRDLALYIDGGGRLTISGRAPILGADERPDSAVADVELTDAVPELVVGLSGTPIELQPDLPPATPLKGEWGPDTQIVMRRGPASADAGIPVMVALTSSAPSSGLPQRAIVIGVALDWLPAADAQQLVRNMAAWMLAD